MRKRRNSISRIFLYNDSLLFYIVVIVIIIFTALLITRNDIDEYEYVDENGDVGYAVRCIPDMVYSKCYKEDGTEVKVIRFHEKDK